MWGTPDTILEILKYLHDRLGTDHLIMYGPQSCASHDATLAKIDLFGSKCYRSSRTGSCSLI